MHEEQKTYQCTECNIKVSRKYHLATHIKVFEKEIIVPDKPECFFQAVHQKEKFWQCEDCDYKTNNQVLTIVDFQLMMFCDNALTGVLQKT